MTVITLAKGYFKNIGQIKYEGPESDKHLHSGGMKKIK